MSRTRRLLWALAASGAAGLVGAPDRVGAADAADAVVLKSGKILQGKVVGETKVGELTMLTVATDFGQILVPATEVKERRTAPADATGAPFTFREMRIVEISGGVQRRAHGETAWKPLFDRYRKAEDGPYADILAGDSVRTEADGIVAFIPHKDVWIRLTPNTEIEIPTRGADASVELKGGDLEVAGAVPEDGREVRVRTGSSTLGVRGGRAAVQSKDGAGSVVVGAGEVRVVGGPTVPAGSTADLPGGAVRAATDAERGRTSDKFVPRPADDLVYVPPGTYEFGGPVDRPNEFLTCNEAKFTARVDGFLIGRTKVTNGDYAAFVSATGAKLPDYLPSTNVRDFLRRRPVAKLAWEQSAAYARWCGLELPTVVQWEAAARGPRARTCPWGTGPAPDFDKTSPTAASVDALTHLLRSPPVDEPSKDLSPFGVVGLVTYPLEYCRDWIEDTKLVLAADDKSGGLLFQTPTRMPPARTYHASRGYSARYLWVATIAGLRVAKEIR